MCACSARTRATDPGTALQRISIEISRTCNLQCSYCYARASPQTTSGLTDDEVRSVIDEAVDCGAGLISIVGGGEPLLRASLLETGASCIDFANERGCYCHLYTNGTLLDRRAARWLRERDVAVVGKLNSLRDDLQDALSGVAGSFSAMRRGIDALLEEGFAATDPPRLSLETIICRQNFSEMPDLWRWMRTRHIVPEVEIPTLHGRALDNRRDLYFSDAEAPQKYREVFEELLAIDRREFGFDWDPHPPFPAQSCRLFYNNCYVNDRGGVQPCAGVEREYGVLRVGSRRDEGRPLAEIVEAPEFRKLREVHAHLKDPCRGCELLPTCYGCRGAAYNATGDIFAGDPVCWRRRGDLAPSRSGCDKV
jgi:radical SAM protein with 4Fe4S-binding SPASM domain